MSSEELPEIMEDGEEGEMTFAEIYGNIMLNEEVIIEIPEEDLERTKTGLKNHKAKLNAKLKDEGQPLDTNVLTFNVLEDAENDGCIRLQILLSKRAAVKVKKLVVPDNKF